MRGDPSQDPFNFLYFNELQVSNLEKQMNNFQAALNTVNMSESLGKILWEESIPYFRTRNDGISWSNRLTNRIISTLLPIFTQTVSIPDQKINQIYIEFDINDDYILYAWPPLSPEATSIDLVMRAEPPEPVTKIFKEMRGQQSATDWGGETYLDYSCFDLATNRTRISASSYPIVIDGTVVGMLTWERDLQYLLQMKIVPRSYQ